MKNYDLIIFDCDGVLVDSETITNQDLVSYLNEFGADMDLEEALQLFRGGSLPDCIEHVRLHKNIVLPQNFTSDFRHRMKVAFEKDLRPVKGVKQLIESIEVPICVASNGPIEKMEVTLRVTGLAPYFGKNIFSAYTIGKWKPEPDLFLHAASNMACEPSKSVVIEDSPRGVRAAKAAGMDALGFDVYGHGEELKKEGATCFTKMEELIGKL